jgi:hypothetical protein
MVREVRTTQASSISRFLIFIFCLSIALPAHCSAARESAVDVVPTNGTNFNKLQMSDREQQLLRPVWDGTMNNAPEGKRIFDRLLESCTEQQAKQMLATFFDGYSGKGRSRAGS